MARESGIEWTEATWNPWYCCHKISPGCKHCYMFAWARRTGRDPNVPVRSKTTFYDPLKWHDPRKIFTCSLSDFFIEEADEWRDEAFAIMALTPQHTYQVLTKRPERMLEYLSLDKTVARIADKAVRIRIERKITFPDAEFHTEPLGYGDPGAAWFPLKNVWLGVSVEDQNTADERIPLLLQTPAAVRWLSVEPLLGPIELYSLPCQFCKGRGWYLERFADNHKTACRNCIRNAEKMGVTIFPGQMAVQANTIDWVVAGGESGPNVRPMHPDWVRSIREQCTAAGVPFFFKQWGEWLPVTRDVTFRAREQNNPLWHIWPDEGFQSTVSKKVGKKAAGRILDGRTWDEMPEVVGAG